MRLTLLSFCLLIISFLPFNLVAQSTKVSMKLKNVPINEVLNEIESKSEYKFLVNQQLIDLNRKVDAVFVNTPIKEIIETIFREDGIKIVVSEKQIILTPLKQNGKDEQPVRISGRVTDAKTRESIPGVAIQVKGGTIGTTTDLSGNYSLDLPSKNVVLVFSFLGYQTVEMPVSSSLVLNLEMNETTTELEGVVVTALGVRREEKALGYSVQKVDGQNLQTIKVADPTTSLTGKVSGLMVKNSTNFGTNAELTLRGENPLIVIDGIPSSNVTLNDISQDDIKSIEVLKGATASALYGYRGAGGAIMITTLRGNRQRGFQVSVNSSTMLNLGFVVYPETQTSYSSGYNGHYADDYIWGDKLDIGRTTSLWDPVDMEWKDSVQLVSKGKNNLKNFQELGLVTNNNISISSVNENSNFRTSITHIHNKGQFPNQKLDKVIYNVGGEITFNKLTIESNFTYSKHISPNIRGSQYSGGYLYNLIGWLGSEWDINEYKNYWMVKDEKQNWFNNEWYDNPYFLANEVLQSSDRDITTAFIAATYKFTPWLKLTLRSGLDSYLNRYTYRNPISARNAYSYYGYYETEKYTGYGINNDLLLLADKTFGNFRIDGLAGGTIAYQKDDYFDASTKGGLSIPGYYSLKASKDPIEWDTWIRRRQVNSLFSRASLSYKSLAFVDLTGRWDWSSTLSTENNPYFYPSVAGSLMLSEFFSEKQWLDMWKLRGSWTMTKTPADIYEINSTYVVDNAVWGSLNSAYIPTELKSSDIRPQTSQTIEIGTAAVLYKNRVRFDITAYQKRLYDFLASAELSEASGYYTKYVNTDEERTKKGLELNIGGTPIQHKNLKWDINFNWSKDFTVYSKLDEQYTPDELWISVGERVDAYTVKDWMRDASGNLINTNGFPTRSNYYSVMGYSNPDWIWGLNTSLAYKNLIFSCSVDGRVGGLSFSRLDALLWNSGAHIDTDNEWRYDEVVNGLKNYIGPGVKVVSGSVTYDTYGNITSDTRVYAPNDVEVSYENYVKDHYQQGAWSWCSQNILDETFIKLREVSITYVVPKKVSDKLRIKDSSVSIIGQNLFYWGKEYKLADPDYGVTWDLVSPSIRYMGLNIKFNI